MSRDPDRRDRARHLRREMTPAEAILWKHLRDRRLAGFKFRRQQPIGPFFADLACYECRLIVELDGESHLGQKAKDERRTQYLIDHDWVVLRFWNPQVYDETEAVLETLYRACMARKPQATSNNKAPLTPTLSPGVPGERE